MNSLKNPSCRTDLFVFLTALFCSASTAFAHDPGLSTATGRFRAEGFEITLALSLKDAALLGPLDTNNDGSVTKEEFEAGKTKFVSAVTDKFLVEADTTLTTPTTTFAWYEANNGAFCTMVFPVTKVSTLTLQSKLLDELPPGHRQFLTLGFEKGLQPMNRLLSRGENSLTINLAKVAPSAAHASNAPKQSFVGFLALGVEHILTGFDHLLFLFALLVVTTRLGSALKIITCFTLAHSITLAASTLNLVQIPSRVVEPLIAASIIYVGFENLFCEKDPKGRWLLTFAFGLIHGFGFASVLRELGVGTNGSSIALPLISFNLGVELGQIVVAAIALPIIWKLRTKPRFVQSWAPVCSIVVALAGSGWLIQRVWF